ncbi:hypothetical protein [Halomonas daqiaonensis]|uniref:Uncharacterized protein n=1 Tax=Halomonas daqiaonensis TaxID=650850 RepID=A0A1H7I2K2_9GAMM|nr:hypothetical protein [Halomonas daqiaonensis]SEK56731.1 hypothetical protein SAMN04488129_1038 [Halomonas daqiaonensis]
MRIVHIKNPQQREACLARLCAEAYGQEAGLRPLATFAGTLGVLIKQEAARVLALVDDHSRPVALALLVLDEVGSSMTVMLLVELDQYQEEGHVRVPRPAERLVAELALKAPLRIDTQDAEQEARFREAGITRWLDGKAGVRIGLGPKHPAASLEDLPRALTFDEASVIQSFKRDRQQFDDYKARFIRGLESFPATL